MGKQPPNRQQVAAILASVAVLLGGGGGAGYYLHGGTANAAEATGPALPLERLSALEKWQAAKMALDERDRAEHAEWVRAIHEMNATNTSMRDAVVALTERMGALDARLRAVEVRPRLGPR